MTADSADTASGLGFVVAALNNDAPAMAGLTGGRSYGELIAECASSAFVAAELLPAYSALTRTDAAET